MRSSIPAMTKNESDQSIDTLDFVITIDVGRPYTVAFGLVLDEGWLRDRADALIDFAES